MKANIAVNPVAGEGEGDYQASTDGDELEKRSMNIDNIVLAVNFLTLAIDACTRLDSIPSQLQVCLYMYVYIYVYIYIYIYMYI
jgi:hypothetical protein